MISAIRAWFAPYATAIVTGLAILLVATVVAWFANFTRDQQEIGAAGADNASRIETDRATGNTAQQAEQARHEADVCRSSGRRWRVTGECVE